MESLPAAVLDDARYRVPRVAPGPAGLPWLRAHIARFSEGDVHRRRRDLAVGVIAGIGTPPPSGRPTPRLLAELGLPPALVTDIALVAAAYQPHTPQSADADDAADRLVAACGGRTEDAAARAGVLVQAHAATLALIETLRAGSPLPPVPTTRRIAPDGEEVLVDLADAPFGRGAHRCPGRDLALHLAHAAIA